MVAAALVVLEAAAEVTDEEVIVARTPTFSGSPGGATKKAW